MASKNFAKTALLKLKTRIRSRLNDKTGSHTVPTLRSNFSRSTKIVRKHWKPLAINTAIYGILYFLFVRVLTAVDFDDLNETIVVVFGDGRESFLTQVITVGSLFGESTNFNSQSGLLFAIVTTISALAMVWVLRRIWGERRVSVKEAFYQGMYPLIPFVLVFLFMLVQLLPFSAGGFIFQTAFNNGLTIEFYEKVFFVSVFALGALVSAYYLVGSIVALYAVTMPGITPSEARRTAKRVLKGRRFLVMRQMFIFLILTGFVAMAPMLLVIWLIPGVAIIATAIMIVLGLPWFNLYLYGLYRDLLDE